MSDAIVMVADEGYFDHARSVLVNCKRQGQWDGDYCIIAPASSNADDFTARGIDVFSVPDSDWTFMTKLWVFTDYFRKWDHVFCTDLDVMVQGPLRKVFDGLSPKCPSIMAHMEDLTTMHGLRYWTEQSGGVPNEAMLATLEQRYPHINERMYNMAFLFFAPESIPLDTRDKLLAIHEEFQELNPTAADQMIVNLLLFDQLEEAGKDYFEFFGNDDPGSRVFSEFRKWRGDEYPSVLHYTRWHAPWIVKQDLAPPMGGYSNERLNRICHELYAENLAAFEAEFPYE